MSDYLAYTSGVVRLFATLDDANAWLAEVGGGKMFVAVERLAAAEAAARWLLYDAPGKPYAEVEAFVRERPWLGKEQP